MKGVTRTGPVIGVSAGTTPRTGHIVSDVTPGRSRPSPFVTWSASLTLLAIVATAPCHFSIMRISESRCSPPMRLGGPP